MPATVLHRREAPPHAAVLLQPVAGELVLEQALAVRDRLVLARGVETGALPRLFRGLDDERRAVLRVAVGVHTEQTVLALPEIERERAERERGPEPHEAVRAPVELGLEVLGVALADAAVHAVRGDDQIRVQVRRRIAHLRVEPELDAELGAAGLQDRQQLLPAHAREAVSRRRQHLPAEMYVDVVPVGEARGDGAVALGIGACQVLQRRVREHDTEAEGVVRTVALQDRHPVGGVGALHQDSEVEAGGAAADADDSHFALPSGRPRTTVHATFALAWVRVATIIARARRIPIEMSGSVEALPLQRRVGSLRWKIVETCERARDLCCACRREGTCRARTP